MGKRGRSLHMRVYNMVLLSKERLNATPPRSSGASLNTQTGPSRAVRTYPPLDASVPKASLHALGQVWRSMSEVLTFMLLLGLRHGTSFDKSSNF